jgi:hypothetical protein
MVNLTFQVVETQSDAVDYQHEILQHALAPTWEKMLNFVNLREWGRHSELFLVNPEDTTTFLIYSISGTYIKVSSSVEDRENRWSFILD